MDIEPIEETGSLVMTCAGDTAEGAGLKDWIFQIKLHDFFCQGGGCVAHCKISELMDKSNIKREELTCTHPPSLQRLFVKSSKIWIENYKNL